MYFNFNFICIGNYYPVLCSKICIDFLFNFITNLVYKERYCKLKTIYDRGFYRLLFFYNIFLDASFSKPAISSIVLSPNENQTMNINSNYNIEYEINPNDAKEENLSFIFDNTEVVSFEKDNNFTTRINSVEKSGTDIIYIKTEFGVTSNKVIITVEDKESIRKVKEKLTLRKKHRQEKANCYYN